MMIHRRRALLFWLVTLALISFAGCLVEIEFPPTRTVLPSATLTVQPSPTLTHSPTPTQRASLTPTFTATPTPAPVTWTIKKGDELLAIAFYYGINLEELLMANPSVTPNWMSVGTVLQIPVTPTPQPTSTPTAAPTHTPQAAHTQVIIPSTPLELIGDPACYREVLGGLTCIALVRNSGEELIENPSVSFKLTSLEGEFESELVVFAPLNLLPSGSSLPVMASFPSPVPLEYNLAVEVEYWLPTMPDDDRYAEAEIVSSQVVVSANKLTAQIQGQISVEAGERDLAVLWLLATAFDQQGNPIGFRRWEAPLPLNKGGTVEFKTIVYSLGPDISKVELMAEARFQSQ